MRRNMYLSCYLLLLGISMIFLEYSHRPVMKDVYEEMLLASEKTAQVFSALKAERLSRGLALNHAEDPEATGLIGENYTEITTTLGNPEAKRSTCNPNTGALYIALFQQLGLEPGDQVAVNMSGSFPALNLALLSAMDTYGLTGVIISSVGASSYGANLPDFTYLDMEHAMVSQGLLEHRTTWFSLGGQNDQGEEMPEALRESIVSRLRSYGYQYLDAESWEENLALRQRLYQADGPVKCLINVGGNLLSFGKGSQMSSTAGGILTTIPSGENGNGLIPSFLREGIPVIHLLNIKDLFVRYGLPIDPRPTPAAGDGDIYWEQSAPRSMSIALLIINGGAFLLLVSRPCFRERRDRLQL